MIEYSGMTRASPTLHFFVILFKCLDTGERGDMPTLFSFICTNRYVLLISLNPHQWSGEGESARINREAPKIGLRILCKRPMENRYSRLGNRLMFLPTRVNRRESMTWSPALIHPCPC